MRSFRTRLTLWNAGVIAVVLALFSVGIVYANQARMAADIDRELMDRATHSPPPPGRGGQGGPGGQGGQPGQPGQDGQGGQGGRGGQPGEPGQPWQAGDQGGPPDQPPGQGNPPDQPPFNNPLPQRLNDPTALRIADIRRPRRFDPQGRPVGILQEQAIDLPAVILAAHGNSGYTDGFVSGEPVRIYTQRMDQGPNQGLVVQVAREMGDVRRYWTSQLWTLGVLLPIAILAAGVGASFLTSRALKPISKMREAANAIGERDLSRRLAIEGDDEFAELGRTFNAMFNRLEDSFKNLHQAYASLEEAHEAQKRFTADASHELRTPLTRMRLATSSALAEGASSEDRRKALEVADAAAESMGRLVREMMVLARADSGQLSMQLKRLDLRALATDVMSGFSPERIELIGDMQDTPVMIDADADHLQRVLHNLIENSLRYTHPGGSIRVSVCADEKTATLKVADTGEGIAPEHVPHLTERFYRADPARARSDGGCGLGLAICKTIVEAHGGSMSIESTVGQGTVVSLSFPKS